MYFTSIHNFFYLHGFIVTKLCVLGTPKLGVACMAPCTLQCILRVSLESSCNALHNNEQFGALLRVDKFTRACAC